MHHTEQSLRCRVQGRPWSVEPSVLPVEREGVRRCTTHRTKQALEKRTFRAAMSTVDTCASCPACDRAFNLGSRAPRMLLGCLHTVCLECVQVIKDSCPVGGCKFGGTVLTDHVLMETVAQYPGAVEPSTCCERNIFKILFDLSISIP